MNQKIVKKLVLVCYCFLFVFGMSGISHAQRMNERIISFDSVVEVKPDSTLIVEETIKVNALGANIKRGIYRDFPTKYVDRLGNNVRVGFEVIEIQRDGVDENYHMKNMSNGKRIYIGNKDVYLKHGVYTYKIVYETTRQIGYFDDHDEIYWNVTGNGWNIPIDSASATVVLPDSVKNDILEVGAYTGISGSRESAFSLTENMYGEPVFNMTRKLNAREGLTVFVSWPKGFIKKPTFFMNLQYFFSDNKGYLLVLGFLFALAVYYYIAWDIYGRDPDKGTIVPLFRPPEKMSPAAMRFLMKMGYDNKVFTAAVLNIAVKGYFVIDETEGGLLGGKSYKLSCDDEDAIFDLSVEERKAAQMLLASFEDSIELKNTNHYVIQRAMGDLKKSLKKSIESIHFHSNYRLLGIGFQVYFVFAVATFFFLKSSFLNPIAACLFWGGGMVLNMLFGFLLKAPTEQGRKIMDKIEGFKMFLSVTEKERMNFRNPPNLTPKLFEKYLPYALALDVEQKWAEQFSEVFAKLEQAGKAYSPRWYAGPSGYHFRANSFSQNLGSSFSSAISSSSTPPGSSSGGGGGGFSGGGGGGGGGGGW